MAIKLETQIFEFGKLSDKTDEFFLKDSETPRRENVTRSAKGKALTIGRRPGFADFTEVSGSGVCRGLFQWVMRDGTRRLIGIFDTTVKYWTPPTWTTLTTISNTESSVHFTWSQWLFDLYFNNGSEKPLKWNHISTPTSVSTAPKGKFSLFHKNQLFHFNITNDSNVNNAVRDASYQFMWSNIAAPDTYTATDVINIDGEISGAFSAPTDVLIIFSKTRMEIMTGSDSTDFYKLVLDPVIGCTSHYGIVGAEGYVYFPSYEGFYRTSGLDRPKLISEDINGTFLGLDPLSLQHMKGAYDRTNRRIYWLASELDSNGIGSPAYVFNTVIVYDINLEEWNVYKTDLDLTQIIEYQSATNERFLLFGTYDGKVLRLSDRNHIDVGSSSGNVPWVLETGPMFFKSPQIEKNFQFMRVYLKSTDRRTIPVTFYTDMNDPVTQNMALSSSTSRNNFLGTGVPVVLRYTLGTDSTLTNLYDFVDVPINLSGRYLKVKFGDALSAYDDLEFNLMAYEIYYKKLIPTGSPEYV